MPHTRAATLHMRPKVNDTLVSNMREPMLILIEDSGNGVHDTLMAACDPYRYKGLGVEKWEEHGSCAENLVLALKELNERAGLKGAKGVGADVTINSVPAPLNLWMNIPWDDEGDLGFKAPKSKAGDYVRLKASRDVVVVMSACPQDILEINNKQPADAHFIVEEDDTSEAIKRTQPPKKAAPRKLSTQKAPSTAGAEGGNSTKAGSAPQKQPVPARRTAPAQKMPTPAPAASKQAPAQKPAPKPVQPQKKAAEGGQPNGDQPVEKKKPRKLNVKPKEASQDAS